MTNSLSKLNPEFWAREAERTLFVENKAMVIANLTLRNLVAGEGDTVNRTILSYPASTTYVPGTDIDSVALTGSSEALTIGTWLASLVTIDDTEKKQSIVDIGKLVSSRMMHDHNNRIEQAVLAEITNANWTVDSGNVGGTAGNPIAVTTDNVPQVFVAADTKLDAIDAPKQGRTAVVGSHFLGKLKLQQAGRDTVFGDGVNTRGVVAQLFGWDILYSNNIPYSATLGLAANPTAGDTVTIAGVTFTFRATLNGAGSLHIADAVDATRINMAAALNAPGTAIAEITTAGYEVVASEDAFLLRDKRRITATNDSSADTLAITGYGDIVVAETFDDATDAWADEQQDSLFCVKGFTDMIIQIPPRIEVVRDPDQFSDIVKSLLGFGKKTYADGAREAVKVEIDASTSDWS